MEKVVAVLMAADRGEDWCERQRGPVADAILALGVPGLTVNVRDAAVRQSPDDADDSDRPGAAVSIWTQQCYGDQIAAALGACSRQSAIALAAYLVTESVAAARTARTRLSHNRFGEHRVVAPTGRTGPGDLVDALAARPHPGGDRNPVHLRLHPERRGPSADSERAGDWRASSKSCSRPTRSTDLKAFFGAADDADLQQRLARMVASTTAFGANENIDTVPTSRYVLEDTLPQLRRHR